MSTPKRLGSQEAAAATGGAVCWIFAPLGFGSWQATVATVTGLIAKEEVVSTMGVLFPGNLTANVGTAFTAVSASLHGARPGAIFGFIQTIFL